MKFLIEFVQYTKVPIDADSIEDAKIIAGLLDGDDISEYDSHEYNLFDIKEV